MENITLLETEMGYGTIRSGHISSGQITPVELEAERPLLLGRSSTGALQATEAEEGLINKAWGGGSSILEPVGLEQTKPLFTSRNAIGTFVTQNLFTLLEFDDDWIWESEDGTHGIVEEYDGNLDNNTTLIKVRIENGIL